MEANVKTYIRTDYSIDNSCSNIYTSGEGGGILVKGTGVYLVRARLHMVLMPNDVVEMTIERYLEDEYSFVPPCNTYVASSDVAQQYIFDFVSVFFKDSADPDRFVLSIKSQNGGSSVFGTSAASDSILSVVKIG